MLTTEQPIRIWVDNGEGRYIPIYLTNATLLRINETLIDRTRFNTRNWISIPGYELNDKRDPLTIAIPMTVVYALLLISGLIGNICTCVIIVRNKYMHTATNYYLFSLAISDLLLLVLGLPQEIYQVWEKFPYIFGEAFCIFRGLSSEMSTNASILTITAFTVERYVAICHPLKTQTMSKLNRAIKFIVAIWLISAVCAAPLAAQFGIVYEKHYNITVVETATCSVKRKFPHSFEISTFIFFLLPMSAISVLYVIIAMELRRTSAVSRMSSETESVSNGITKPLTARNSKRYRKKKQIQRTNSQSSRRDVVKMLVAVVVAFFLCWAPFHAQRLMAIYVTSPTRTDELIYTVLTYISGVTYYVSATINPILYSILSVKFRQAFKETLARCCRRRSPRRDTSYSFRYQSTVRTTTGYDASDVSSTYDSPRRTERVLHYSAPSNKASNSKSTEFSFQRPEQNGNKGKSCDQTIRPI